MKSKTLLITGANSGLGLECIKTVIRAKEGWRIIIASRNIKKSEAVIQSIKAEYPDQQIRVIHLDLGSLESVRFFVDEFRKDNHEPIDALICNSGIIDREANKVSKDGYDMTFAVNHLGHFLLTNLLINHLSERAKIVVVSSNMHNSTIREGKMAVAEYLGAELLSSPTNNLDGFKRYSTSKLCNLLFAYELVRKLAEKSLRITVNSFDPGFSPGTGLMHGGGAFRNFMMGSWLMKGIMGIMGIVTSTPTRSGKAMARLILDESLNQTTGKYFQVNKVIKSSTDSYSLSYAQELWKESAIMVKLEASN